MFGAKAMLGDVPSLTNQELDGSASVTPTVTLTVKVVEEGGELKKWMITVVSTVDNAPTDTDLSAAKFMPDFLESATVPSLITA